ncbi:MAG: hypothetical protein BIFFINMI_03192 [Phycisphaerae bacterium]|nr:hypothetical protein [Phycisphaerae bacterium]
MGLLELITGRKKGLMSMTRAELRQQELLLGKQRDGLMKKIEDLAAAKREIFGRGAKTKSPEVRRALAMEFEARTQEQVLYGRQLNIRSKELLTVTRVRLARENRDQAQKLGMGRIAETDMVRLAAMIEDDAVSAEVYGQRLDELLAGAAEADKAAMGEPTDAAATLMHVWDRMDRGVLADEQAFDEADEKIRSRARGPLAEE